MSIFFSHKKNKKQFSHIPYDQCPAKTWTVYDEPSQKEVIKSGRTVLDHCSIVASTAQRLIERMPEYVQQIFPKDSAFAAGCHDIGKVSPYFYQKLRKAINDKNCLLSDLGIEDPSLEISWGGHAGVSQVSAIEFNASTSVASILGRHHGSSPPTGLANIRADGEVLGGELWQKERKKLYEKLKEVLGMDWPIIDDPRTELVVSGLTTVADWIGSSHWFEDPNLSWQDRIDKSLDDAGFIYPKVKKGLSFHDIFGFDERSEQADFLSTVDGPGVYVMEAPMGLGKTESALYAAYKILSMEKASGIYFALPTQLTSNKIFERFNSFLSSIFEEKVGSKILHGNAWLYETEMGEECKPGGNWFDQSKRGLLAPFSVGTLDQALMAIMRVKHGFVRSFALAGKVVILDEVHSYDMYTGTLLEELVDFLASIGCTVIILSATLHSSRLKSLLKIKEISAVNDIKMNDHLSPEYEFLKSYPLVTCKKTKLEKGLKKGLSDIQDFNFKKIKSTGLDKIIKINFASLKNDFEKTAEMVIQRAMSGEQVLWIENSVGSSQKVFSYILSALNSGEFGSPDQIDIGLLHSRFTPCDREKIEKKWVFRFGKDGWEERVKKGSILVGTQILEQSLDLDADFMITAFCPSDMLLQRLGRLWRHQHTPRPKHCVNPEVLILSPDLDEALADPEASFEASAFVYSPYILCRSLEVWKEKIEIVLPSDIRKTVEETYALREETGDFKVLQDIFLDGKKGKHSRKGVSELTRFASQSLFSTYGSVQSDQEQNASTRFVENEFCDVLICKSIIKKNDACEYILADGSKINLLRHKTKISRSDLKQYAMMFHKNVIKVPSHQVPEKQKNKDLKDIFLSHVFYLGPQDNDDSPISISLLKNNLYMIGWTNNFLSDNKFLYCSTLGYRVDKDK